MGLGPWIIQSDLLLGPTEPPLGQPLLEMAWWLVFPCLVFMMMVVLALKALGTYLSQLKEEPPPLSPMSDWMPEEPAPPIVPPIPEPKEPDTEELGRPKPSEIQPLPPEVEGVRATSDLVTQTGTFRGPLLILYDAEEGSTDRDVLNQIDSSAILSRQSEVGWIIPRGGEALDVPHALLRWERSGNLWTIAELHCGWVRVNGVDLRELPEGRIPLQHGDRIDLPGDLSFWFKSDSGQAVLIEEGEAKPQVLTPDKRWLISRCDVPIIPIKDARGEISTPHLYLGIGDGWELRDLRSKNGSYVSAEGAGLRPLVRPQVVLRNEFFLYLGGHRKLRLAVHLPSEIQVDKEHAYRLRAWVGHGGQADVYQASPGDSTEIYALKLADPRLDPEIANRRFEREKEVLEALSGVPGVPRYVGGGVAEALLRPFVVMEFIPGINVKTLLRYGAHLSENGKPLNEALVIIYQVAEILKKIHQRGWVHCDLKPGNVRIHAQTGDVYLLDFSLAVQRGFRFERARTVGYSPPEIEIGSRGVHPPEADKSADIYSLGIIFYELLTGCLPPREWRQKWQDEWKSWYEKGSGKPPEPKADHEVLTETKIASYQVRECIARCLQPIPANRYQSVEDFLRDFLQAVAQREVVTGDQGKRLLQGLIKDIVQL